MSEDPIVAETRKLREEMLNDVGHDLDALVDYIQKRQVRHGERLVSFPPRPAVTVAGKQPGD
jgi:hypothetical protein